MHHISLIALRRTVASAAMLLALALPAPAPACDVDADCGPGGTCIKREKRASGVCYGRAGEAPAAPALPEHVQNRDALAPGLETSGIACQVTQQCPAGLECVIIEFRGQCMRVE